MWLLFGPGFVIFLTAFIAMLFAAFNPANAPVSLKDCLYQTIFLAIIGGLTVFLGSLLYKTTRNYIRLKHRAKNEPDEPSWDEEEDATDGQSTDRE